MHGAPLLGPRGRFSAAAKYRDINRSGALLDIRKTPVRFDYAANPVRHTGRDLGPSN
jgi:hypothetical protein